MGGAYSTNTINDGVDIIVNVLVEATQKCQTTINQTEGFNISASDGANVDIGSITAGEFVSVDLNCTQNDQSQTSIDNSVGQTVSQIAKATTQQFSLSDAKANNNSNFWVEMGTTIKESFNQTCKETLVQNEDITITATSDSTVTIGTINFNESIDSLVTCIQNDSSVNDVKNKLQQTFDQEATAVVESILGPILILLIVVAIIIGLFIFGGAKSATESPGKMIVGILVLLILGALIYFGLAYWRKWPPFSKKSS